MLYLPEVLVLLKVLHLPEVLCLLNVFYFRVPIGLTVSRRIPSSPAKTCFFFLLTVKNADLYHPSLIQEFQILLFQQVLNFGVIKDFVIVTFPQIESTRCL